MFLNFFVISLVMSCNFTFCKFIERKKRKREEKKVNGEHVIGTTGDEARPDVRARGQRPK